MKRFIHATFIIVAIGFLAACTENSASKQETERPEQEENVVNPHDKQAYGIEDGDWELSPTFEHSLQDTDGKEHAYTVVGSRDGVGFTGPFPITANEKQKYFWFYFGEEDIYDQPVEVKAIKKGTEEWVHVLSGPGLFYEGARVSPDSVNMPSHLSFPTAGIWKIVISIDGKVDDTIVVEVV